MKGKKVLMVGLGILGGGLGTARFLLKQGVKLVITDKREKSILQSTISKLPKTIQYTLGRHIQKDFKSADFIIVNPAVPRYGEWITYATSIGKSVFNDLTLFLDQFPNNKKYIAITGTRGKTTTTLWIHHMIESSIIGGNIPHSGPLAVIHKKGNPFVLELSSFQLEYMKQDLKAPHIALITNLYQDHLNRHGTMDEYIRSKSHIFLNQTKEDYLIINSDNSYSKNFLSYKPQSRVLCISISAGSSHYEGIYIDKGYIYVRMDGKVKKIIKSPFSSDFENQNLMGAMLVAYLYTKDWQAIVTKIKTLPYAPMRREVIIQKKNTTVVNDSAGTSPDATIALLSTYRKTPRSQKILITGGTNKMLDFKEWAQHIQKEVDSQNLFFFEGSATLIMIDELRKLRYFKKDEIVHVFSSLKDIVVHVSNRKGKKVVLFSPSSASFEKFKNEFDRGNMFTRISHRYF